MLVVVGFLLRRYAITAVFTKKFHRWWQTIKQNSGPKEYQYKVNFVLFVVNEAGSVLPNHLNITQICIVDYSKIA
jgi:hypothetical protein